MRKGQTEIIGLLVIVVLFVIIFFLFLAFSGKNGDEMELRQSLESSNFLTAMMFYTPNLDSGSCGKQIRDIIEECRENKIICEEDCKEFLDDEIRNILNAGMDKPYRFTLNSGYYRFSMTKGNCNTGIVDSYKTRDLEAVIRIC